MRRIIIITEKILVKLLLFLIYVIGFGITYLFVAIFKRSLFQERRADEKSFWKEAQGYSPDIKECLEQS